MTFKAGQSGNPNDRPNGSKNKQTLAVTDRLEALGCDSVSASSKASYSLSFSHGSTVWSDSIFYLSRAGSTATGRLWIAFDGAFTLS
jgi:hypothetical protein